MLFPFLNKIKKSCPNICWDRINYESCGATRLDAFASAFNVLTYAGFCLRRVLLRRTYWGMILFRLPSEVHSVLHFPPYFHRQRLSEKKRGKTYLLFLIGLLYVIKALFTTFVKGFFKIFRFCTKFPIKEARKYGFAEYNLNNAQGFWLASMPRSFSLKNRDTAKQSNGSSPVPSLTMNFAPLPHKLLKKLG